MQAFGTYSLIFAVASSAAHFVIYRWALATFPGAARHRRAIVIVMATFILVQPLTRSMMRLHDPVSETIQVFCLFELLTVAFAAVPIGLVRLFTWLLRERSANPVQSEEARAPALAPTDADAGAGAAAPKTATMTRRQTIECTLGVGFLGATGSTLGWGMVRGRHAFEIEEVVVRIAGLPRALDGYTIAQVSDIHSGLFVGPRDLAEGLSRVAEIRPDLVVATGDLVDLDSDYARVIARKLHDLSPRDGVAAILGNHDYYADADAVAAALRAAGIDMLINAGKRIRPADGGGFALLGVDDVWAPRLGGPGPNLGRALAMVPPDAPRILLSHQPKSFDLWTDQVALQLSGHTHGGQINPGFCPATLFMKYVAGRYQVGNSTLYVNRGFGTAGPPSRVGAPPEITKVVLVAA